MYKKDYLEFANELVKKSLKAGCDEAEVYLEEGRKFKLEIKDGEVETLEQAGSKGLGLRIFKDKKLAFGYTSDFNVESVEKLLNDLIVIAGYSDSDSCNGLPSEENSFPVDLELYDEKILTIPTEKKIEITKRMEDSAKGYDRRITRFKSSTFFDWAGSTFLVNSRGVSLEKKDTYCYIACIPLAEEGNEKQMSFWYSMKRHFDELASPEEVGLIAAEKAVKMLGAKPVKTQVVPVVFSPLETASLCTSLGTCLGGQMIYRKSSFLVDKIGQQIASDRVNLIDDGLIKKGPGSTPFDGEGTPASKKYLIEKGVLKNYLFDTYYARKMNAKTTGNATRSYSSVPYISTTNLYMDKGDRNPDDIIKGIDRGLYVTSTMGSGLNEANGDYSVGAEGYWIEKGEFLHPVSQVTISANFLDVFKNIVEVGNDLYMMDSNFAPTVKISQMTVSGK
jgi:PmbA protein